MTTRSLMPLALLFLAAVSIAGAAPTGLNTIPTTDIVPFRSWIAQIQNGNTSFDAPAFYSAAHPLFQTEFGLTSRIEAGADYVPPGDMAHSEILFNAKALLVSEDEIRPNVAAGIWNIGMGEIPGYYLTVSKTLNYAEQQAERFRAHHRRNRKLLGQRIHAGLMMDGHGLMEPFLGTDLQMSQTTVFQADWMNGAGNAISAGAVFVLADQRTVLNPAFLFSNAKQRLDGFFLNVSHQFNW